MGFEVPPSRIGDRHSRLLAGLVALAAIAVVASGLAAALVDSPSGSDVASLAHPSVAMTSRSADPSAAPLDATSPVRAAVPSPRVPGLGDPVPAVPAPAAAVSVLRPYPSVVVCGRLGSVACAQLVLAAVREVPDALPPVAAAVASASVICGEPDDCPPARFVGYRPLGSVVLSFGPFGPVATFDVAEPVPYPGRVWDPTDIETWMVRWRRTG